MTHCRNVTTRFVIGLVLTVAFWLDVASAAMAPEASDSLAWLVMHSFDGVSYTPRGTILFSARDGSEGDNEIFKVMNNPTATMSPEDVTKMLDYGWYHIMIFSAKVNQQDEFQHPVALATIPACHLRRANFRDEFMFVVSRSQADAIVSVTYAPVISPLAPKTCDEESLALMRPIDEENGVSFESKVSDVSMDVPGMALKAVLPQSKPPPGMSFLPNPNRQRSAKAGSSSSDGGGGGGGHGSEGGEPETPPGPFDFVKRYWYIFVPMLILNFVSSDQPAQTAAAGPAGPAGAVTAGAAVAGAAVAAVGTAAVASTGGGGGGGDGTPTKRSARRTKQNK